MTFEEAKQRADYSFTLNGIEDLIPGIRKNWMEAMDEDSVPYNGCAVLTIGYVDIEVNVHTEEQIARNNCQPGNKIGTYASETRCLEILSEIEMVLQNECYTTEVFDEKSKEMLPHVGMKSSVYIMPQE